MTVPNIAVLTARPTEDECIRAAGAILARHAAIAATLTVEEAALACYRPDLGGPSLQEIEAQIRLQRGLAVAA
ncbi:hypothetical protein [Oerskovia paurometabola]|uniref:hypothetical protein n=1 Tax=Oerskovia paurometabola TaxID=162170 RepID=UPI00380D5F60